MQLLECQAIRLSMGGLAAGERLQCTGCWPVTIHTPECAPFGNPQYATERESLVHQAHCCMPASGIGEEWWNLQHSLGDLLPCS